MLKKIVQRKLRHKKIRSRISGTATRPRLSVYKSNSFIYAQAIDDVSGKILVSSNDMKIGSGTKSERAVVVGKNISEACQKADITEVVFDRGGFQYIGRVKALADAAREAGLKF